ncbi:MAG: OmpA family protein [Methylococcaceae bacterium]|nr:OmpA family protein [Methylococcaceae bacterium]
MADCPKCPPVGAPLWLATFADLMSLLMCFFVLLLSFATMDAAKFKATAESMENAFGVQRDIEAAEIPMGTSIIAQHFSPASTDPTLLEEIKQSTSQSSSRLDVSLEEKERMKQEIMEQALENTQVEAEKIEERLKDDINKGLVSVETQGLKIIIRINEKGSFGSGTATLKSGFEPVMNRITDSVITAKGKVLVAGHTDDIPISTEWYRSNWELSAGRSVTVAEFMLKNKQLDQKRVIIEGHADSEPLVPNTSNENRAKNRRVEVILVQDDPTIEFEKMQKQAQEK